LLGAAAIAVVSGLVVTATVIFHTRETEESALAPQAGLVVETGRNDDIKLDPKRPLRCFVGGMFVGEMPVSACATRNGVGVGALDVGIDTSGSLAGAKGTNADITPLPPAPPPNIETAQTVGQVQAGDTSVDDIPVTPTAGGATNQICWRYADATWIRMPDPMTRSACLQSLYDGRCLSPGAASYGRWGDRTVRLTAGRIESSSDNRIFRTIAQQGPACSVE
jgi:hypothetical protein